VVDVAAADDQEAEVVDVVAAAISVDRGVLRPVDHPVLRAALADAGDAGAVQRLVEDLVVGDRGQRVAALGDLDGVSADGERGADGAEVGPVDGRIRTGDRNAERKGQGDHCACDGAAELAHVPSSGLLNMTELILYYHKLNNMSMVLYFTTPVN
jgi:hypothetical protein